MRAMLAAALLTSVLALAPAGCTARRHTSVPSLRLASVPVPQPGARSGLDGIASVGTHGAWAVGAYQPSSSPSDLTEALHWDGQRWRVVATPDPCCGWSHLFAVAGEASDDAWAVGTYAPSNGGWPNLPFRTLAEHWNGSTWSIVPTPTVGEGASTLLGVTVLSSTDAWAVGGSYDGRISWDDLQCEHTAHILILHWDGTAWHAVPSPDPGKVASFVQPCGPSHPLTTVNVLSAVSATGPRDVWAVGHFWNGSANRTLVLHWNGARWAVVLSPNASVRENVLYGVAAVSSGDVWAVGTYEQATGGHRTLTENWNGRAWHRVPSPNVGGQDNLLFAVAGRSAVSVWAVGRHGGGDGGPLAEHWNGTRWEIVPSQEVSPGCRCSDSFNGVATSSHGVWVAGEYLGGSVHESLVETSMLNGGAGPR